MLPSDPSDPSAPSAGAPVPPSSAPSSGPDGSAEYQSAASGAAVGEPVATAPVRPAAARAGSSARGPILALALVIVSVLAGGTLFLFWYFLRPRHNPARPGPGVPPVLGQQQAH